jgi:hypothetical protein
MGLVSWLIKKLSGPSSLKGGSDGMTPLQALARDLAKALPAQWPDDMPPLAEYAEKHYRENLLQAAVMIPDQLAPSDPLTTRLGGVAVMAPGEAWPVHEGQPMLGLAQINLTECPLIPPSLEGIALLTVFMAVEKEGRSMLIPEELSSELSGEFVVRAYDKLDSLRSVETPGPNPYRPHSVSWKVIDDPIPHYDAVFDEFRQKGYSHDQAWLAIHTLEELASKSDDRWLSKVGGGRHPSRAKRASPCPSNWAGTRRRVCTGWTRAAPTFGGHPIFSPICPG